MYIRNRLARIHVFPWYPGGATAPSVSGLPRQAGLTACAAIRGEGIVRDEKSAGTRLARIVGWLRLDIRETRQALDHRRARLAAASDELLRSVDIGLEVPACVVPFEPPLLDPASAALTRQHLGVQPGQVPLLLRFVAQFSLNRLPANFEYR